MNETKHFFFRNDIFHMAFSTVVHILISKVQILIGLNGKWRYFRREVCVNAKYPGSNYKGKMLTHTSKLGYLSYQKKK